MKKYFFILGGILLFLGLVAVTVFLVMDTVSGEGAGLHSRFRVLSRVSGPIQERAENRNVSITFLGDMMFDRHIREMAKKSGYDALLKDPENILGSSDVVVGNLEGPITGSPSRSVGSVFGSADNYIFTFDPEAARFLYDKNIRVVNIGNNHILNFGVEGLAQTKDFLQLANVGYFGAVRDDSEEDTVRIVRPGVSISVINYNQFSEVPIARTIDHIGRERARSDIVIVYTHWGIEYETHSSESQREKAHNFIDAGADMVIGSHPHVVQEKEIYHEKMIYYSLGNAIFDQYFSSETRRGLAV